MRGFVVFLATVLGSIGIGVGVEAASPPATFGTATTRFFAAFPGPVSLQTSRHPIAQILRTWTYTGTSPTTQLVVDVLLLPPAPPGVNSSVFLLMRNTHTPNIPPKDLRTTPGTLDGMTAARFVGCLPRAPEGRNRCAGSLTVLSSGTRTHRIQWTATASGPSAARVGQLLSSFAPVGA